MEPHCSNGEYSSIAPEPRIGLVPTIRELQQIGGVRFEAVGDAVEFQIAWADRPDINIKREADFRDPASTRRRRRVAKVLREEFEEMERAVQ